LSDFGGWLGLEVVHGVFGKSCDIVRAAGTLAGGA